ncbi:hypothetical protein Zmor_016375 [Zophobas morio]|uniref:Exportin-1 n=1 Tax=Zophobas morio TaxID=2755281 RepID=A0AA38LXW2_9CUCU|nr:hypothetical protein Zmor_016375 [Zophobas morio]
MSSTYLSLVQGHAEVLEAAAETHTLLLELHQCLLAISEVDDREIFKVCLEYWRFFSELMYTEASQPLSMVLEPKRRSLYTNKTDIMNPLRRVLISKMVKPEEVLVVENENGELVREFMPAHTDTLSMFQTMQETLVYLTRLDFDSTKSIMVDMLSAVVLSPNWTWQRLNTLCWAIGAISGTMPITEEEQFLVKVIKYLLGLCDQAKGKSNKAVVASNIMYVVGQYPRFLKAHWNFLSVVVKKLFEFMHESHEGVQDMSCDTFLKISKQCARSFVTIHVGESHPFVNGILSDLRITISDLQPQQVETFYEAVGHMIAAQNDLLTKQGLIMSLMELPNQLWTHCIRKVAVDQNELRNEEVLKSLSNVLRLNIRACQAIGHEFVVQIDKVFSQMLTLYNVLSNMIAEAAVAYGEVTFRQPLYRRMHSLKHDFLCLLKTWIGLSNNWEYLRTTYLGQILGPILDDYRSSAPPAKEPEVLQLLKALCDTYGQLISASIPIVFDAVFECTLDMITKDLSAYPTHRINFYRLLASVSGHCFQAFVEVTAKHFQLIIDSVVWAMKHAMRNVCESGLNILHHILSGVGSTGFAQQFYTTYYLTLLGHLLSILTDSTYQHAFDKVPPRGLFVVTRVVIAEQMASILSLMIDAVDAGRIRHPLSPEHSSNKECVQAYLRETLTVAFPTLHSYTASETIIQQLFTHYADSETFKGVLSDFLVQTKVYEDEREIEAYTRDAQVLY